MQIVKRNRHHLKRPVRDTLVYRYRHRTINDEKDSFDRMIQELFHNKKLLHEYIRQRVLLDKVKKNKVIYELRKMGVKLFL